MAYVLLKLGDRCNNVCEFCHVGDKVVNVAPPEMIERVRRVAQLGYTGIYFSGGEPTIRKDLPLLIRACRSRGMVAAMISNARKRAGSDILEQAVHAGLQLVQVSLHGSSPQVHDAMVRTQGAFKQTLAGLRSLVESGVNVTVNTVLCRENMDDLPRLRTLLGETPGVAWKISFCESKGYAALAGLDAQALRETCVPRLAPAVSRVRALLENAGGPRNIQLDGFPPCLLPEGDPPGDLLNTGIVAMWLVDDPAPCPTDMGTRVHAECCRPCRHRHRCPGFYAEYLDQWGDEELQPEEGPVSNSFDLLAGPRFSLLTGACPLPPDVQRSLDPIRDIVVRHTASQANSSGEAYIAHTDTRDFSLMEIRRVIHESGQVYRQADDMAAIDDFASQLRLLRPVESCADCAARWSCPGVWAQEPGSAFQKLVEMEARFIATLKGRVLDVGCGAVRHEELFARAHEQGRIVYHGLDPDGKTLRALEQRRPRWFLRAGAVEDLPDHEADSPFNGPFDVILVLRSHNHFKEPARAYRALVSRLAPGGRLIIADNAAFALVRSSEAVEKARRGNGGPVLEHRRNDTSGDARHWLEDLPVQLLREQEIRRGTPNQWNLVYQRPAQRHSPEPARTRPAEPAREGAPQ